MQQGERVMGARTGSALYVVSLLCLLLAVPAGGRAQDTVVQEETPMSTGGNETQPNVIAEKTFERWPDPVVLDCGLFSSLLSSKVDLLRMYAFSDGEFRPIPFQVDERDAEGNRVYTDGEKANPGDANGLLDKGEELSFMARDCGDRVSEAAFPPGVERWQELELEDPVNGGKGWVYLLYAPETPPPASTKDYIRYLPVHQCEDGDCQLMQSEYFEDHFYPMAPYVDISKYIKTGIAHRYMSTPKGGGGTGVDYVDRFKGRVTMAFLFGSLKFA